MATLKPCVQKQRSDGFFTVYIRVTHNRKPAYIKTSKVILAARQLAAEEKEKHPQKQRA